MESSLQSVHHAADIDAANLERYFKDVLKAPNTTRQTVNTALGKCYILVSY